MIKKHKWAMVMGIIAALAALAIPVAVMARPAGYHDPSLVATASVQRSADTLTYSIFLQNNGSEPVGNLTIQVPVPAGATLVESYAGQSGQYPAEIQGDTLFWNHGQVAPGARSGPFAFVVKTTATTTPAIFATVTFTEPEVGVVTSTSAAPSAVAQDPRRGCFSCHEPGSTHNLVYEAESRAKAAGLTHPPLAEDVTVEDCLTCHAAGTGDREGMGAATRLSMSGILHPSHMFSQIFGPRYSGNCFSCHTVDSQSNWDILNEAVEVNEKGLPENSPMAVVQGRASTSGVPMPTGLGSGSK